MWQTLSKTASARSRDGAVIGWEEVGEGPALLVLHGGGRCAKHYRELATHLAATHRVILMDRRGRGLSPSEPSSVWETVLDDVSAVMEATGAHRIFGHSAGALVALEAALHLPIRELALFEPPLPADTGMPLEWVADFEAALSEDKPARAMALMMYGLEMGPPSWLPRSFVELGLSMAFLLRQKQAAELRGLLRTLPFELKLAERPRASAYAALSARTLLLHGSKTPGYLRDASALLSRSIPGAESIELPGQGHNAPDLTGPEAVARALTKFFGRA